QPTRQLQTRPRRTTRPRLSLRLHPFAVDLLDCRGVSRVGVAGYQHGPLAAGTVVDLLDGLLAVLGRAFAGHHDEQQAVLGVDRRVVPVVALVVVAGVVGVAVLLLLADVVPLLVELDFAGL